MPGRKATVVARGSSTTAIPERKIREDSLSSVSDGMSKVNERLETLVTRLSQLHDLIVGPRVETTTGADAQKSVDRAFIMVAKTKLIRSYDLMGKVEQLVEDIIESSE